SLCAALPVRWDTAPASASRNFLTSGRDGSGRIGYNFPNNTYTGSDTMKRRGVWFAAIITSLLPFGGSAIAAETIAVFTKSAGNAVSFIGDDDYAIAVDTARYLFKAMEGKGNLVILEGPETIPTAVGRLRGFRDVLKEFPNIKVMLSKNALYARPAAKDLLTAMLKVTSTPQIDGVLASNDAMAFGAVEAFKEQKKKMPLIVSINASKEAVDLIKAGDMLASGDYNGLVEGCLGTEVAIRTLRKEPVPKEVMAKTEVV